MVCVAAALVAGLFVVSSADAYGLRGDPVDCAYSEWSQWAVYRGGKYEYRTRQIYRHAQNGGQECQGRRVEYRLIRKDPVPESPKEFMESLLVGKAPSYSLGGGQSYTLARDIVIALDNTVNTQIYPYYKSFLSNVVGKLCGDFGGRRQDNRMSIVVFDSTASVGHSFSHKQQRAVLQDTILKTDGSNSSWPSDLTAAINKARWSLDYGSSDTRQYNSATKEVLLVTTYKGQCTDGLRRAAERLKTTAEVYVIVVGHGKSRGRPNNWCIKELASTPTQSHFIHLEGIRQISKESRKLLARSTTDDICKRNTAKRDQGSQFRPSYKTKTHY